MASFYFDTSALLKLYIDEEGSSELVDLTADVDAHQLAILDVTFVEARSAIRRRQREHSISSAEADAVLLRLEQDGSSLFLVQPATTSVIEEASRLIDSHPLRAYDAVQLAGFLIVRPAMSAPLTFVCADLRLCDVARLEGIPTFNPLHDRVRP